MNKYATARSLAKRQCTRDRSSIKRAWYPKIFAMPTFMVKISYPILDSGGEELICVTWFTANSEKLAIKKWLKTNPGQTIDNITWDVVSSPQLKSNGFLYGDRIEMRDITLESIAS